MARPIPERTFDPTKPLIAVKEFTAGGRRFKAGDSFNWKQMSVSQRKVLNMFGVRLVDHPKPAVEVEKVIEKKVEEPKKAAAPKASKASKTDE